MARIVQLAGSPLRPSGPHVRWNYELLNGTHTDYILRGDTTYYVSGTVILNGTTATTIEGGTVVKFAPYNPGVYMQFNGTVRCLTDPYRPAIFTARDDNTVGEVIPGSTGTPSGYYASTALYAPGFTAGELHHLNIRYAMNAITWYYMPSRFYDLQLVNCYYGIGRTYNVAPVHNVLLNNVVQAFWGYAVNYDIQHATVNQCTELASVHGTYSPGYINLLNCVLANVSSWGSYNQLNANYNAHYNTPPLSQINDFPVSENPFKTVGVGAANHYLAANSTLRNVGTPSIDATLAEDLKQLTTYGPVETISGPKSTPITLSRQVARDTDTPDLGYHYAPLDYLCSQVSLTATTVTLTGGVAVGLYGSYGFSLKENCSVISQGRPEAMNRLAWYPAVQEQSVKINNLTGLGSFFDVNSATSTYTGNNTKPIIKLRFTDCAGLGRRQTFFYPTAYYYALNKVSLTDNWLRGVDLTVAGYNWTVTGFPVPVITLQNNLVERSTVSLFNGYFNGKYQNPLAVNLYNNLFWNTTLTLTYNDYYATAHPAWAVKDNLFDGATISFTGTGTYLAYVSRSNNRFQSTPTGTQLESSPVTVAVSYAPGPFGSRYYISASTPTLVNQGSRNAAEAGLFHYTISTTQQKEGYSTVDIGLHYVALDGSLATSQPLDADGDSVSDYLEDSNGNGAVDSGETAWFNTQGQWNQISQPLPARGIHAHLLPTGKVLLYAGSADIDIYDPVLESASPVAPPGFEIYCSGHTFMSDGTLFVAGGTGHANWVGLRSSGIYSPLDDFWTRLPAMNEGRWYPTCTTLGSGEVLVTSGNYVTDLAIPVEKLPQVWNPATGGQYRNLASALKGLETYPFVFADPTVSPPNAGVFYAGPVTYEIDQNENQIDTLSTWRLSTDTPGVWTQAGALAKYHTSGSAVLYQPIKERPGKILVLGGSEYDRIPCDPPDDPCEPDAYDVVESYDLTLNNGWTTVQPLNRARKSQNATLLPDGTVLVTGGYDGPGIEPAPQNLSLSVLTPELWSPVDPLDPAGTWNWTSLADSPQHRIYHSTAVLLPDARVLTTGGEYGNSTIGEIFLPPYLCKGGSRPVISSATFPSVVNYGQTFSIQTGTGSADSVFRITLVRLSSVTHSVNMNQRFRELSFTGGNGSYNVTAPANSGQCPPGHYLLYVINNVGVPSVGSMLQILPAGSPEVVMVCPANGGIVQPGTVKVSARLRNPSGSVQFSWRTPSGSWQDIGTPVAGLGGHYSTTWAPTSGEYRLKARGLSAGVDSAETAVNVHNFPSPSVTVAQSHYYFPVTIPVTASATASGGFRIEQLDLYHQSPVRLARRTELPPTSASPVSSSFTLSIPGGGATTHFWSIAVDSLKTESVSPVVVARIYGGALDTTFLAPPLDGADGSVNAVAIQPDGKVLIGGGFTTVNGISRNHITRLNKADGSLDSNFNPSANGPVNAIALQSDGKILIGGDFTTPRNRIARLNSDGNLDNTFDPGDSVNAPVYSIAVQAGGKVLIGGAFITIGGTGPSGIARLNDNGTVDSSFNPGTGATGGIDPAVYSIAVQSDGKVLIGGGFTTVGGTGRNKIARLDSGGSLDATFDPGAGVTGGTAPTVYSVALQPDSKVVIGGSFTAVNGITRNRIARLSIDGTLDAGFQGIVNNVQLSGANDVVRTVAVQLGGVLIGGFFTVVNDTTINRIARLNSDGTLDTNFRPGPLGASEYGPNDIVKSLAIQTDGLIVIGGNFTAYNVAGLNATRQRIARISGL